MRKLVLLEPGKQVGLAHAGICINAELTPNDHHLEQKIKSFTDNRHLINYNNTLLTVSYTHLTLPTILLV